MDSRRIFPCLGTPWQHVEVYIYINFMEACVFKCFCCTKSFRFLQQGQRPTWICCGWLEKAESIPRFKWWLNGDESHEVPLDPKMMNTMKGFRPHKYMS